MKKMFLSIAVFFALSFCASIIEAATQNLFKIERNKNANVVMYDVVLDDKGLVNDKNPIDAYWLLFAKDGSREEIGSFEKKAYGYTAVKKNGTYFLTLKAVSDRSIKIVIAKGVAKGEIIINDKPAYLSKVYVFASAAFIPTVKYYTLTGIDIETGTQVEEQIDAVKSK